VGCLPVICHADSPQITTAISETTGVGDLGTTVRQAAPHQYHITGGEPRGNNLFHSFQDFSLASGDIARFQTTTLTPDAAVQNILGRVTGGNPSQLYGTIDSATFYPQANLFLMNPAGIVFGPTATLNVGGSVTFTTAHYLRLAEANGSQPGIFSANPTQSNILVSAPVTAFGFLPSQDNPVKPITVEGSALSVPLGHSLSLVGGNITISSGSVITAPSGQIQLASVASAGETLMQSLQNLHMIDSKPFDINGTIHISNSRIDVSGDTNAGNGGGGTVSIRGGQLVMDRGFITADTRMHTAGEQMAVIIKMGGDVVLKNQSAISATSSDAGRAGDILLKGQHVSLEGAANIYTTSAGSSEPGANISIESRTVSLREGSGLSTSSIGSALSGNITIAAADSVRVSGTDTVLGTKSRIQTDAGTGNGGNVRIETVSLEVSNSAEISTRSSLGIGPAGNLILESQILKVLGGGAIFSDGTNGSGTISIDSKSIEIVGYADPNDRSRIANIGGGAGGTGDIDIHANHFSLSDDARLNMEGDGQLGKIMINATESLNITNGGKIRMENAGTGLKRLIELESPQITLNQGIIQTLTVGPGDAAAVNLKASDIFFDGGKIDSSTCFSTCGGTGGFGGDVSVNASHNVALRGQFAERILGGQIEPATPAGIFSATGNSSNKAGDITLSAMNLGISDGATISSQTLGHGDAGNILITTNDIILGGGATITASSAGTGNAGSITIQGTQSPANTVLIDGIGTGIFTSTKNTGTGGSISLTAKQSISISDGATISASSTGPGNAGNISINAGQQLDLVGTATSKSSITTEATQASGGNIDIRAIDRIRLVDSTISTSVQGEEGSGGNIFIDPKVVILEGSNVTAEAIGGTGGTIRFVTSLFLQDSASQVSSRSQRGVSGTVNIQSPIANLIGTVGQLASKTSPPQVLLQNRCVALAGGEQSTFILTGRNTLPVEPGGWLSSPVSMEHWTGVSPEHASTLMVQRRGSNAWPAMVTPKGKANVLSLRRLTPPGFLVGAFATPSTGCPS
jgi:filamentous hemagglutinin family protein